MKDYRQIVLGTLFSSFVGSLIVFVYFAYVDLETFRVNKLFWRGSQADWTTFALVMLLLSGLVGWITARYARPLQVWERRLRTGEPAAAMPERLRRRAASFPQFMALASLVMTALVGLFFAQGGLALFSTSAATFWRTVLGVALVGGITTSTLVFLIVEAIWRQHLPIFFPDGQVRTVDVWRVPVSLRLIATLLLTGLVPLVILGAAAHNSARDVIDPLLEPEETLDRLQLTIFFVVSIGITSNVLLATLTARSLLQPLLRLKGAMDQVARGDLGQRVPVVSNDELGDLADDFNQMLADLQHSQRMRDLFGRYVSREVAEQVLRDGADLGGESVEATALFADIRDFTGLSERLAPEQVVGILNRYYTRMVDVIVDEGGLVNKFGGDSLLAIFGAPIRQPDHALRAVRAAWQMNRALGEFNAEQAALGQPTLTIGIGISSGAVVAGNVGGERRLEYTIIGDPVNLASRLQSLTKEWGTPVLLSEDTNASLDDESVVTQPRERITVRGKRQPTQIYELRAVAV